MNIRAAIALLVGIVVPAEALSQSATELEFRRRIMSPWGIANDRGADAFAESLLSPKERRQLGYWVYQQEVLGNLASEKSSQDLLRLAGYGVKGVGYAVSGLGGPLGEAAGTFATPASKLLVGGMISVTSAVVGGYAQDVGSYLIADADQKVATRVAIYLNKVYGNVIRPGGALNVSVLRNIGDTNIGKLRNDPKFIEEVGNLAILADLDGTLTVAMLEQSLKDTGNLLVNVEKLDAQIKELDKGYKALKKLQIASLQQIRNNGASLSRVESKVDSTNVLLGSLVASQLPPAQILELARAKVLQIGPEEIVSLERSATAQALRKEFDNAASVFNSVAVGLNALGVDAEVVNAASSFGNLLGAGGTFAAAMTLGEPLSIFNSGAGLLGAVSSVFGRKREDPTQKMLGQILKELRGLSDQIQENHRAQMELLRRIALRIDDLEDTINRRFAELGLDIALLQLDTRELLYEDVRTCERLVQEFFQKETLAQVGEGVIGFAIWFQSDNRAQDYGRCLNGLMARQRISSEIHFSGMLRADSAEQDEQGQNIADRRSSVRRIEQRILQPTVAYLRKYQDTSDGSKIAARVFQPTVELCDVLATYGDGALTHCSPTRTDWPPSRIGFSQFNAGQGALLSTPTALLLSKTTRMVAPWNSVLWENTSATSPRVLSEQELRELSHHSMSRRTRHLVSLNGAADTLDLNIGQAQILAGLPAVPMAAQVIDEVVIPAYAKARLLNSPDDLNRLLAAPPVHRGRPGPNCSIQAVLAADVDAKAWNTLCLMETNPTFAKNVLRAVVAKRLDKRRASFETWRKAVRSPFAETVLNLLGHDVVLTDAAANLPDRSFGIWAIELPRVYVDPDVPVPSGTPQKRSCWESGYVEPRYDEKLEIRKSDLFYTKGESSRCLLLDPFTSESFTAMSVGPRFHGLLSERALVVGQIRELCEANLHYPSIYCSFTAAGRPKRQDVPLKAPDAGSSARTTAGVPSPPTR